MGSEREGSQIECHSRNGTRPMLIAHSERQCQPVKQWCGVLMVSNATLSSAIVSSAILCGTMVGSDMVSGAIASSAMLTLSAETPR